MKQTTLNKTNEIEYQETYPNWYKVYKQNWKYFMLDKSWKKIVENVVWCDVFSDLDYYWWEDDSWYEHIVDIKTWIDLLKWKKAVKVQLVWNTERWFNYRIMDNNGKEKRIYIDN